MCVACYHKSDRDKKAFKCIHSDRALYAKGMCKKCYQNDYFLSVKTPFKFRKRKIFIHNFIIITLPKF
jgi:hypothetical protein